MERTGIEPVTSGLQSPIRPSGPGPDWSGTPGPSRDFLPPPCGDWRVPPGPSADLVRDVGGMSQFTLYALDTERLDLPK
jgi:hypothetical protein